MNVPVIVYDIRSSSRTEDDPVVTFRHADQAKVTLSAAQQTGGLILSRGTEVSIVPRPTQMEFASIQDAIAQDYVLDLEALGAAWVSAQAAAEAAKEVQPEPGDNPVPDPSSVVS